MRSNATAPPATSEAPLSTNDLFLRALAIEREVEVEALLFHSSPLDLFAQAREIEKKCGFSIDWLGGETLPIISLPPAPAPRDPPSSVSQDLALLSALPEAATLAERLRSLRGAKLKKTATALFRCIPLLFDLHGNSRRRPEEGPFANELWTLYEDYDDLIGQSVRDVSRERGMGELLDIYERFKKSAADKTRNLIIERVPALAAVMRGGIGGDCATRGYGLAGVCPEARTHFIRRGKSGDPIGYVLSLEVTCQGFPIPYLLTIAGKRVRASHIPTLLRLVAADWNCSELLVDRSGARSKLYNDPALAKAVAAAASEVSEAEIIFPRSWSITMSGSASVYNPRRLRRPGRVTLHEPSRFLRGSSRNVYRLLTTSASRAEKAIAAARVVDARKLSLLEVLAHFGAAAEDVSAAGTWILLLRAYGEPLSAAAQTKLLHFYAMLGPEETKLRESLNLSWLRTYTASPAAFSRHRRDRRSPLWEVTPRVVWRNDPQLVREILEADSISDSLALRLVLALDDLARHASGRRVRALARSTALSDRILACLPGETARESLRRRITYHFRLLGRFVRYGLVARLRLWLRDSR